VSLQAQTTQDRRLLWPVFTQEIWWLVAKELANQADANSLPMLARTSKDNFLIALPLL